MLFSIGLVEGFLPSALRNIASHSRRVGIQRGHSSDDLAAKVIELDERAVEVPSIDRQVSNQERHRRAKPEDLRTSGGLGYPAAVARSMAIEQARECSVGRTVAVVGRVNSVGNLGGIVFAAVCEDR